MNTDNNKKLLKVYMSSTDKYEHEPLYEVLARKAKACGVAGVTVSRGIMGYGTSSELISPSFWEITEKVAVVLEAIDTASMIETYKEAILPIAQAQPKGCLITEQPVDVVMCKKGGE